MAPQDATATDIAAKRAATCDDPPLVSFISLLDSAFPPVETLTSGGGRRVGCDQRPPAMRKAPDVGEHVLSREGHPAKAPLHARLPDDNGGLTKVAKALHPELQVIEHESGVAQVAQGLLPTQRRPAPAVQMYSGS